ncbi:FHA domain-containing protein [Haliangium ochraceum]|uniref:FHA domain containing protein n=1 Tax=Haliangium ochraceum (strain DSM 14365 / JCM 11303 / SMP-2) TaxID=502025 RepID=D0LP17_HALO1|nr:FHA domain-containing protein [Haliangium ochraceum]ACY18843.1 FHA domain containing protein [Haliangium ochraceum DSM 14365]
MSTIAKPLPSEASAPNRSAVGGLRILRTLHSRLILFDSIRYKEFPKQKITIGWSRHNDIRIRNPTVSSKHCHISRSGGGFWLVDEGAKNGVFVDDPANRDGRWHRVSTVQLQVGMRLLLGEVRISVTDQNGECPMNRIVRFSDYCRRALRLYGNPAAAASVTGLSRRFLTRFVKQSKP